MDLKDLNRSQFILLLLLVILITSTTTAIVAVALLDQSPKNGFTGAVTQVVERTIEKIVPGATTTIVKIVKETSVLPNEGELIARAVTQVSSGIVSVGILDKDAGWQKIGIGFAVSPNLVVTDAKRFPLDKTNAVIALGKVNLQADLISRDNNHNVAFFRMKATGTELSVPPLVDENPLVGQTVVGITLVSDNQTDIATGLILDIVKASATSTGATSTANILRTNAVTVENIGGPVVDTEGRVVGIGIARGYALAADTLRALLDQIK